MGGITLRQSRQVGGGKLDHQPEDEDGNGSRGDSGSSLDERANYNRQV